MADRRNHYEAAFEAFLRDHRIAYVAVDETRRSLVADGSLKSLDFIVSTGANASWLVDVKGRRFPSGDESRTYWKNWSTRDDLRSLAAWQSHFGPTFCPILVFAYHLVANRSPLPTRDLFRFRGAVYGFLAVPLADYVPHARTLSESWDTVALPTAVFRRMARPWSQIVAGTTWVPSGELVWQELPSELQ
jgi:hypothetical protein